MAAAQLAYVARFAWYAAIGPLSFGAARRFGIPRSLILWGILPSEILHGLTYAVMWSAIANYAKRIAPDGMVQTSMSVASTMHWTLGFGTGATVGGQLFARLGGQGTFQLGAVFAAANCLTAIFGWSKYGKSWDLDHNYNERWEGKKTQELEQVKP
eukprot:SAG31_NODE_345_length_17358_cov_61.906889_10_plen_156_part_00